MDKNKSELFDEEFLASLEQLHLIAKKISTRPCDEMHRSRKLGDGLEFADHRAYAEGDDIRFIDWPYFARMEKLLLRMFHEHSDTDVTILLDTSASMAPGEQSGKFDYARKTAAALAYVAMGSLQRINILPFAEKLAQQHEIHTGRNRAQIMEVLDFLKKLTPDGQTEITRCMKQFADRTKSPQTILLISDLLDCEWRLADALAHLRTGGHDVAVLHLYSPQDSSPEFFGDMLLLNSEDERKLTVNVSDDLLENYNAKWKEFTNRCQTACTNREAIYVAACTDMPFEELILKTLKQAGVLERQ